MNHYLGRLTDKVKYFRIRLTFFYINSGFSMTNNRFVLFESLCLVFNAVGQKNNFSEVGFALFVSNK